MADEADPMPNATRQVCGNVFHDGLNDVVLVVTDRSDTVAVGTAVRASGSIPK